MFVDAHIVKKESMIVQITLTDQLIETTKSTRLNFTDGYVFLKKKYEGILAESFHFCRFCARRYVTGMWGRNSIGKYLWTVVSFKLLQCLVEARPIICTDCSNYIH